MTSTKEIKKEVPEKEFSDESDYAGKPIDEVIRDAIVWEINAVFWRKNYERVKSENDKLVDELAEVRAKGQNSSSKETEILERGLRKDVRFQEYWHSFKGTSYETNDEIKNLIWSAFNHGFDKSYDQLAAELAQLAETHVNMRIIFRRELESLQQGLAAEKEKTVFAWNQHEKRVSRNDDLHKQIASLRQELAEKDAALQFATDPDGYFEAKPHKMFEIVRLAREVMQKWRKS